MSPIETHAIEQDAINVRHRIRMGALSSVALLA